MLSVLPVASGHWRQLPVYFGVMHAIIEGSKAAIACLMRHNAVSMFIGFMLDDKAPLPEFMFAHVPGPDTVTQASCCAPTGFWKTPVASVIVP